jgi:hypothetical protein
MESNLQTGLKMKNILQLSVLSTAIALAGCGGGGGFYGPETTTTTTGTTTTPTTAPVATNYHIVLNASKSTLVVTGDTAVITEKLVDVNGGGISGQTVTLSIPDTLTNGVTISGASTAVTDASGNATFTINLPASTGATATALLAKGVTIGGSFTDATGKVVKQSTVLSVVSSVSTTTPIYHLTMSSNKPSMVITGDAAIITVKAVDTNGGAVAGQNITFTIPNTLTSGVTLSGPSVVTTDANGNAVFNITLPNDSSPASLASLLEASGITFNASLTNADGSVANQTTVINVVPTPVTTPVANITFGNSGLLITSTDGTYYTEAISANVVNINGQPIANQPVVMSINPLSYAKGEYNVNPTGTPVRTSGRYTYCSAKPFPNFVQIATTFVGASTSPNGTVTYTTDGTGSFSFQVRYLKRYGTWQTDDLIATATVNGTSVTSSIPYLLNVLQSDYTSTAGQPFDTSPYGVGLAILSGAPLKSDPTYSADYNAYLGSPAIINGINIPSAPDSSDINYDNDYAAYSVFINKSCQNQN